MAEGEAELEDLPAERFPRLRSECGDRLCSSACFTAAIALASPPPGESGTFHVAEIDCDYYVVVLPQVQRPH